MPQGEDNDLTMFTARDVVLLLKRAFDGSVMMGEAMSVAALCQNQPDEHCNVWCRVDQGHRSIIVDVDIGSCLSLEHALTGEVYSERVRQLGR